MLEPDRKWVVVEQAGADGVNDARDVVHKFIEVNPRIWRQVGLTTDRDLDLPLIQHRDLTKQPMPAPTAEYKAGLHWMGPLPDTLASPSFYDSILVWRSATSRPQFLDL